MRGRLSESGFEESFEELVEKYPKAEEYLRHTLYKDRHRWAAAFSVLKFSISSFTSSRVEGGPLRGQHVSEYALCFGVRRGDHGHVSTAACCVLVYYFCSAHTRNSDAGDPFPQLLFALPSGVCGRRPSMSVLCTCSPLHAML